MNQTQIDSIESAIGIKAFVSTGIAVNCLNKHRFSDFIVNEITPDGTVVWLQNQDLWKEFQATKQRQSLPTENPFTSFSLKPNFVNESNEIFGEDVTNKFLHLVEMLKENPNLRHFDVKVPLPESKDARSRIHQFIREHLPFLESLTRNVHNTKKKQKDDKAKEKAGQQDQPEDDINFILIQISPGQFKRFKTDLLYKKDNEKVGKFLHFTLMKRNMDSINAGMIISKFLGISNKHFSMAGTKDKRGVTTQRVSLQGITKEQLEDIQSRNAWNKNMVASDYKYEDYGLRLGDLQGNKFGIVLRFTEQYDQAEIQKNIQDLQNHGFINYFGLQRFGANRAIKTHDIGRQVLKQDWKEVFSMILRSSCQNDINLQHQVDEYLQDFNHKRILRQIPYKLRVERSMIQGLENLTANNFMNAFMNLPRNARELYAHAYQSYLWNQMASERIQKHGNQLIIGDLVQKDEDPNQLGEDAEVDVEEEDVVVEEVQIKTDNEPILVTEANISQYTIDDVVLPMYGGKTNLSEDSFAYKFITQFLQSEGIMQLDFQRLAHSFNIQGGYRKLVCKPENVKYQWIQYSSKDQDLVNAFYEQHPPTSDEEGKYSALFINFNLRKSAYATMLIRELTKQSSTLEHQQSLIVHYNSM